MLHAAHNLLEVLDHAKERQLPARQTTSVQVIFISSNSSNRSNSSFMLCASVCFPYLSCVFGHVDMSSTAK